MGKLVLLDSEIKKIKELRETGHSLIEIKNIVNRGYGTVFRYIKDVAILPKYQEIWRVKRGGSKAKSIIEWEKAKEKASTIVNKLGTLEKILILSCLYWGEGNKTELSVINSDPEMIRVILVCLKDLGVNNTDLKISLRLFNGIDGKAAINFWTDTLKLPHGTITKIDLIQGNKVGKLKYGMCRLRVKKSQKHFKLIMSVIDLIKSRV